MESIPSSALHRDKPVVYLVVQSAHERGLKCCQREELDLLRSLQQTSALIQLTGQYFWLLDLLHYLFYSWKGAGLWAWYPSVISSCQPPSAGSFATSLLNSVDSVPLQAWRLQESENVSLSCNPKMVWVRRSFASGGASLRASQHPYASSVLSAGCRTCKRGVEEENLRCLFLFPIIPLCPCNLLLLPNSLFSASFSTPNTFSSLCSLPD